MSYWLNYKISLTYVWRIVVLLLKYLELGMHMLDCFDRDVIVFIDLQLKKISS